MQEILPGIWFVEGENRGRYPFSHSLLIDGDSKTLVDTGAGEQLKELVGQVDQVLLTHYHRDHVTMNASFSNAEFAIHKLDAPGVESEEDFFWLTGMDKVDRKQYWKMVRQPGFTKTNISQYLAEGDRIDTGRFTIQTLHLPGHTSGHCGFLVEEYNLIFAADIDLTSFGPWYANRYSDPEQFRVSIHRLRELKPDILVSGHKRPLNRGIEQKLYEYESELDRRYEKIISALENKPADLDQLAALNIIYRNHHGQEALVHFEKVMLEKHLQHLIKSSLVSRDENDSYYLQ